MTLEPFFREVWEALREPQSLGVRIVHGVSSPMFAALTIILLGTAGSLFGEDVFVASLALTLGLTMLCATLALTMSAFFRRRAAV